MTEELKNKLCGVRIDFNFKQRSLEAAGKTREAMIPILRPISDQIHWLEEKITNEDPDPDPEPVDPLPEKYQVKTLVETLGRPIQICPVFIPDLLISTRILYDDIVKYVLPNMTSGNYGNAVRFFLAGVWERYTLKETRFPYNRLANGKFDLPAPHEARAQMEKKINPDWFNEVVRRVKLFASHGVFVSIDLIDNCSLHLKPSHWGLHWMNPMNNNQNCHPHPSSQYHYYEYWWGGADVNKVTPAESKQYEATGLILEAFYAYAVSVIYARLSKAERLFVGFNAGNEVVAGYYWHERMKAIIGNAAFGAVQTWKKFTSMGIMDDYSLYKKGTFQFFNYAVHGVGSIPEYLIVSTKFPCAFLPSCDGFQWIEPGIAFVNTAHFLQHGALGYELLEGLWDQYGTLTGDQTYDLEAIDWKPGAAAMRALKEYIG